MLWHRLDDHMSDEPLERASDMDPGLYPYFRRRSLLLFHRVRLARGLNRHCEAFERGELGLRHAVDRLDRAAEKRGVRVAGGGDLVVVAVVRAWTSTIW
jgi:hypothetical protein